MKFLNRYFIRRFTKFVIMLSGAATVMGCNLFFYEEELPEILKKEHPFKK